MANQQSTTYISFPSLLFLAFLILKLCGVIDWSWWWITVPLWGGFAILAVIGIIAVLWFITKSIKRKLKRKK